MKLILGGILIVGALGSIGCLPDAPDDALSIELPDPEDYPTGGEGEGEGASGSEEAPDCPRTCQLWKDRCGEEALSTHNKQCNELCSMPDFPASLDWGCIEQQIQTGVCVYDDFVSTCECGGLCELFSGNEDCDIAAGLATYSCASTCPMVTTSAGFQSGCVGCLQGEADDGHCFEDALLGGCAASCGALLDPVSGEEGEGEGVQECPEGHEWADGECHPSQGEGEGEGEGPAEGECEDGGPIRGDFCTPAWCEAFEDNPLRPENCFSGANSPAPDCEDFCSTLANQPSARRCEECLEREARCGDSYWDAMECTCAGPCAPLLGPATIPGNPCAAEPAPAGCAGCQGACAEHSADPSRRCDRYSEDDCVLWCMEEEWGVAMRACMQTSLPAAAGCLLETRQFCGEAHHIPPRMPQTCDDLCYHAYAANGCPEDYGTPQQQTQCVEGCVALDDFACLLEMVVPSGPGGNGGSTFCMLPFQGDAMYSALASCAEPGMPGGGGGPG